MGALRGLRVPRARYAAVAAALTGAAAAALVGCDPAGGLDSVTVSVVTGKQATDQLERSGVRVAYLTCQGKATSSAPASGSGSPAAVTAVGVDCEGKTSGGKKILVYGTVTGISGEACVRGNLTGKVDGKTKFTVTVLGDCSKASTTAPATPGSWTPWTPPPPSDEQSCSCPPARPARPSPSCSSTFHGK
ncbi:hypothetical protein [Streptomyces morookaense]|uniref:Lipoprotein n=1 Tax=Streptomyces morookaense TaxID=1970 RepID=A0A7Y7B5Q3_STRMO|nr:hypothetical protein [Streptomyces morookaense]NVK79360.1 hypothetical protein [Streptomyces morookaense]GHF42743.1 hypothetical protein GCM10010359_51620 [Streptomyces morookaense]